MPTYTHMAISQMIIDGTCKFVVSTNIDGLHRRSGIEEEKIAELHGNCYKEVCVDCRKEFLRSINVGKNRTDHRTGRNCDECNGELIDSIINFGEKLPVPEVEKTYIQAKASDLAIVLGTSMRVQPANMFPAFALENENGKMVICNLQETPYDSQATLLIHAKVDDIMFLLAQELGIEVPEYNSELDPVRQINEQE